MPAIVVNVRQVKYPELRRPKSSLYELINPSCILFLSLTFCFVVILDLASYIFKVKKENTWDSLGNTLTGVFQISGPFVDYEINVKML